MAGAGPAHDALWRANRRWVAAVVCAHLPQGGELEDLLQDVAMKMVTRIHTLKSPESFLPWLRTVARNVAVSAGRKQRVRRQAPMPAIELQDPAHDRDRQQEPVRDLLDQMMGIAARLHLDYREPLLLRCVEGMSQEQIAAALDLPVTTVETRLARARRLLANEAERIGAPPRTPALRVPSQGDPTNGDPR
jgi:RNA polymerase sigma-70 factor (ECF subfamily)